MKRAIIFGGALLACVVGGPAANAMPPHRTAHLSECLARQRADISGLDRYGGYLPSNAPALMQQIMNPMLDVIRTRCLPTYDGPPDAGWDYNSPTIAPAPAN
jgi:hypothetical protein